MRQLGGYALCCTNNTLFSQKCERVKLLSVSLRRRGGDKKMGDCWEKRRRREKTNSLSKLPRAFKRTEEDTTELGGL